MRFRSFLLLLTIPASAFAVDHQVAVISDDFIPDQLTIAPGDRVIWSRNAGIHNVHADDDSFGNTVNGTWTTFERVFPSTGSFPYHCQAHSSPAPGGTAMNGTITVAGGGGSPGALGFADTTVQVNEGGNQAVLTVQRTGGDDGAVSVGYATANGSANEPADYEETAGTLNWADNDDDDKTIVVPIEDDGSDENNETFTVTLSGPTGGATLGASTATVTIQDNDTAGGPGTIRFTQAAKSAGEGDGTVTLTAERTGGTTGAVGVSYATSNESATAPADYADTSNTLSWGNGDGANKSFTVGIVDDGDNEGNETFTATLSAPTGGASLGNPSAATVTINDNDTSCVPTTCVTSGNDLCLAGGSGTPGRFKISVQWTDFTDATGPGIALQYTPDSGFFYFFDPNILELLVKIVNGCGFNDAYWFFYGSTSNVGLVYTVTDLQICDIRTVPISRGVFSSDGDITFFDQSCG